MSLQKVVCQNCLSEEFYEDERGGQCCVYCGTQSQDVFAESREADDGMLITRVKGRLITTSRKATQQRATTSATSEEAVTPPLLDFLAVYQYCLKLLLSFTHKVAACTADESALHNASLHSLWINYLHRWNGSHNCCTIKEAFTVVGCCKCSQLKREHPFLPSKQLMLGFIYLVLRVNRSPITPSDLASWCRSGAIPFNQLWENMSKRERRSLRYKDRFAFVATKFSVFPVNVLYYTASLIEDLGIVVPPLCAPVIARRLITQLGLPDFVWNKYAYITQLRTGHQPIVEAEQTDVQYVENIMAVIVVAVKFCDYWYKWNLVKEGFRDCNVGRHANEAMALSMNGRENFLPAYSFGEFGSIPRSDLDKFCDSIINVVPQPTKESELGSQLHKLDKSAQGYLQYEFNDSIAAMLLAADDTSKLRVTSWIDDINYDVSCNPYYYCTTHLEQNPYHQAVYQVLDRCISSKTNMNLCTYFAYYRNRHDETGCCFFPQSYLLERCAKFLSAKPFVLDEIVLGLEKSLVEISFEGRVKPSYKLRAKEARMDRFKNHWKRKVSSAAINAYSKYHAVVSSTFGFLKNMQEVKGQVEGEELEWQYIHEPLEVAPCLQQSFEYGGTNEEGILCEEDESFVPNIYNPISEFSKGNNYSNSVDRDTSVKKRKLHDSHDSDSSAEISVTSDAIYRLV